MNPVALSPAELRTADRIRAPILSSGLLTLLVVTGLLDVSLFGLALGLEPMLSQRDQAFVETAQQFDWLSRAAFAATIATYLIFVWWLGHRAAQLSRLRIAGQRHVPRFVIITSLLPVINGFLSLAIITELWKASSPKVDFEDTRSWRELPASNLLIWWWISLMAAGTGFAAWVYNFLEIARSLKQGATLAVTEALSQHFTITLVFSALQLTSVLLTLALVVWLNDRQQKRFRAICWHNQEHSLRSHEAFAGTSAHSPLSVTHCFQALGIAGVFFVLFALAGALFELPAWVNVVSSQVVLMAVALSLARSERVPLSRLACLTQPSTRQLMSSVMVGIGAFGFAALTFLPLLAQFFANQEGEAQFQQLIESSPSLLWILPLLIVIVAPLVEEILFRGVLFEALASALSTSMVILITTVVFALIHLNPPQIIATFILGVHCGLVRWASGSVVPAIFVHLINNLGAITFLPMLLAAESVSALLFASVALMTIGYGHLFGPLIRQRLRTLRSVAEQAQRYRPALEASVHRRMSDRLAVAVAQAKPRWVATLDNLSNIARFLLVQLRRGSLTHLTLKLAARRFKDSG
ncbi:MAG: CPBP family glutamic-type intramembrane protease, partial [Acidobacteriota bacterium]